MLEISNELLAVNLCSLLPLFIYSPLSYCETSGSLGRLYLLFFMTLALFLLIMVAIRYRLSQCLSCQITGLNARVYTCAYWQNTKHAPWEHAVEQIPEDSNTDGAHQPIIQVCSLWICCRENDSPRALSSFSLFIVWPLLIWKCELDELKKALQFGNHWMDADPLASGRTVATKSTTIQSNQ